MITRNTNLSFDRSTGLLKAIFPGENWAWFLSKNLHGLTEEFATIPFDNNASEIAYQLGDLEKFAVEFGHGDPSAEEIASIIDEHLSYNLLGLIAKIESEIDPLGGCGEFLVQPRLDADGNTHLDPNDISALLSALQEIAEEQMNTGYTLTTLAHAFRSIDSGAEFSSTDATALSGVAIAQAGRSCDNAQRIRSLFNAFDSCLA